MDPTPLVTAGATLPPGTEADISTTVALAALLLAVIVLLLRWRRDRIARETLGPLPPEPR